MERKVLIKKLGEYFGVKPSYLGTPSFAYELVTKNEVYTILKDGQITTSLGDIVTFDDLTIENVEEINATS